MESRDAVSCSPSLLAAANCLHVPSNNGICSSLKLTYRPTTKSPSTQPRPSKSTLSASSAPPSPPMRRASRNSDSRKCGGVPTVPYAHTSCATPCPLYTIILCTPLTDRSETFSAAPSSANPSSSPPSRALCQAGRNPSSLAAMPLATNTAPPTISPPDRES
jgi:hypothetical protein